MYDVFSGIFLHIRKSLCHATRCDKPFLPRKGQAIPADVDMGKQPVHAMQREQESLHHSRRGKRFHAGIRHEKGLRTVFPLSHMHYVGRRFRLLNQPSRPSPAPSKRFSRRKFRRTEIFCRKPKGKRGVPQGRTNFDEEGENHPFHKYHFLRWHRIFPSPSFPAYGTGFPCRC